MGHFLGVLHDDIKIEHIHFFGPGETCAGRNCAGTQRGHPVGKSYGIALQPSGCLIDALQAMIVRIRRVINRVLFNRSARRVHFIIDKITTAGQGLGWRNIWGSFKKRQNLVIGRQSRANNCTECWQQK